MSTNTIQFKEGDYLLRQGEIGDFLYFIKSGNVKVFRQEGGYEVVFSELSQGAVIGEMSLIEEDTRIANAVAMNDVTVIKLSRESYTKAVEDLPPWLLGLCKTLMKRLRNADEKIERSLEEYGLASVSQLILYLAREKATLSLERESTEHLLESMLRTTTVKVLQNLKELEDFGFLELSSDLIKINNMKKLQLAVKEIREMSNNSVFN